METIRLDDHYRHLRHELELAYSASEWDSQHIDRIADEIVSVEIALASRHPSSRHGAAESHRV